MTAARRWPVLLLVALAARALTFGNPLVHADEQFYFTVARGMWHGQLPYLDIWDRKPLGLFLLYMLAAALPLPWGTLAYQVMALACVVATAALVARFAERAGWGRGALTAGAAYILWLDLLNGSSGQSPVFYNLPVALAAWLVATRADRRAGLAAMALVGVALQIKPAAVFEGMFLGLWLLRTEWRARRSAPALLAYAAALVALALLPTIAAWGFYAARGAGAAWWQANVTAVFDRRSEPAAVLLHNATKLVLVLSPLLGMAAGSRGPAEGGEARVRRFLYAWLAVAVGGVVAFGGWFDHYGLPIVAPAAACGGGFFAKGGRRFAAPILLAAALAGQIKLGLDRHGHGDGGDLARLTAAIHRQPPGPLFVYTGEPLLYPESGRPTLSRYRLPSHLYLAREDGAVGTSQATELRRILAARPEVIVVAPRYKLERPDIRATVLATLASGYTLAARVPFGAGTVAVYRLRSSTPR